MLKTASEDRRQPPKSENEGFSEEFIQELQTQAGKVAYGRIEIVLKAGKPIQIIASHRQLWKENL